MGKKGLKTDLSDLKFPKFSYRVSGSSLGDNRRRIRNMVRKFGNFLSFLDQF